MLTGLAHALGSTPPAPPAYFADLDGDGRVTAGDERLLRKALSSRRGRGLVPRDGYDYRADLHARGFVDHLDLDTLRAIRSAHSGATPQRPITVAWHYSWYHSRGRRRQTAEFLGGNYRSREVEVEATFNDLKNEFGITVDGLSWISPRVDRRPIRNLRRGLLSAKNVKSRHLALLYESTINLRSEAGRVNFGSTDVRGNLVEDFGMMGSFLRDRVGDTRAKIFRLDGRPVVFIYASHTWVDHQSPAWQFDALDAAIEAGIERFTQQFGTPPFLVGEEVPLAPGDVFGPDRQRRSRNFDAMFVYHHAASREIILAGGGQLGTSYIRELKRLLHETIGATAEVTNRFTGQRLLLIPSLAAGFSKVSMPRLAVSRASYTEFLRTMSRFLDEEYYIDAPRLAPAPVVTLGSWNEEFEGHALFPFKRNTSVPTMHHAGFDLVLAVKEVFGWNRYARRPILS